MPPGDAYRLTYLSGRHMDEMHLRRESLAQIWDNFQRAWKDPRVAKFIDDLARDPGKTSTLHQWVYV